MIEHLREKKRNALISHPQELLEKIPMTEDSFATFLHQNYPPFFSSVADYAAAAEAISLSDEFFCEWTTSGKVIWSLIRLFEQNFYESFKNIFSDISVGVRRPLGRARPVLRQHERGPTGGHEDLPQADLL